MTARPIAIQFPGRGCTDDFSTDVLSIVVCTTRHWQTSGRLVQELNVCTVHVHSSIRVIQYCSRFAKCMYSLCLINSCLVISFKSIEWTYTNSENMFGSQQYSNNTTQQRAHLMVCNRSWHLSENPKLVGTLLTLERKEYMWICLRIPCI